MKNLILLGIVSVVLSGCLVQHDPPEPPEPDTQVDGYVKTLISQFVPRVLMVGFKEESATPGMLDSISNAGCVPSGTIGAEMYLVTTPLGYSLAEIESIFRADSLVDFVLPDFIGSIDPWGSHTLMAEDESGQLYWMNEDWVNFAPVLMNSIIRVYGVHYDGGSSGPVLEAVRYEILYTREVTFHGTVALIDRGAIGIIPILVSDSDGSFELLGSLADLIKGLPGIDGAGITITGSEENVSVNSRAGGQYLNVISYVLD